VAGKQVVAETGLSEGESPHANCLLYNDLICSAFEPVQMPQVSGGSVIIESFFRN